MGLNQKQFASDNAYIKIVQDNSHLVAQAIPSAIAKALESIGLLAEGHVIGYMTREHIVDTGRLRNSITHAILENRDVIVGTNVEYARYVHEGHRTASGKTVAGRPFLRDPIQQHRDEYREMLKKALENA